MKKQEKNLMWLMVIICAGFLGWGVKRYYFSQMAPLVPLRELRANPAKYKDRHIRISGRIRWAMWGGLGGETYIPLTNHLPWNMTRDEHGIGFGGGPNYECMVYDPKLAMPDLSKSADMLPDKIYQTGIRAHMIENSKKDWSQQEPVHNSISELTGKWKVDDKGAYLLEIEKFKVESTAPPPWANYFPKKK